MRVKLDIDSKSSNVDLSLYTSASDKIQDSSKIDKQIYEANINANAVTLRNTILPAAVRYLDLAKGIVLFERPPCYVQFNYSNVYQANLQADHTSMNRFNLPIPWQRYVLFLAHNGMPIKIYVFFANAPIKSLTDDPLSYAPLPNLYEDCSVCLPVYDHVDVESFDLISAISNAYDTVWKTGFNIDILKAYQAWFIRANMVNSLAVKAHASGGQLDKFFRRWASYSLEEIVNINWCAPAFRSFNYLLEHHDYSSVDFHERIVDIFLAARS